MRAMTKSVSEPESAQPIEPSTNTAIAARNTVRAPNRSAVQPLAGIKIASDNRYDVTASLSASGLVPISAAIAGSEVAITVESMFSMNSATATISGTMRLASIGDGALVKARKVSRIGGATNSRARPRGDCARRPCHLHQLATAPGRPTDDLSFGSVHPAARPAAQRPAVRGH